MDASPPGDFLDRRHFLGQAAFGLCGAALASLPGSPGATAAPGPHHPPTAKRAISLFMSGAPSQHDLFDWKPGLLARFGTDLPPSVIAGQRLTTMTSGQARFPIAPTKFRFQRHDNGGDGAWISELLPFTAGVARHLAIVKSLHTEAINHDPAITYLCTGRQLPGWPSLGSWLSYGLGSENQDLPAFVVMQASWTGRKDAQALYNRLWGSGMLPSRHQGVTLRPQGDPVLFLDDPPGVSRDSRRRLLDVLGRANGREHGRWGDPETLTRISQYEMAFRMQASVPDLVDLSGEPASVLSLYGPDVTTKGTFAASCLLARRLIERGVRFVQIFHRGWDQHGALPKDLPNQCRDIDQACAGLITDLDQRGLLDETLVTWGSEFGRTVYCQGELSNSTYGRDHHPRCFTGWLAGGGVRGGIVHGETDDFGYNIVRDPVHVRDLNATILHLMGLDHKRLTYRYGGRDYRLTDVFGNVVQEILA